MSAPARPAPAEPPTQFNSLAHEGVYSERDYQEETPDLDMQDAEDYTVKLTSSMTDDKRDFLDISHYLDDLVYDFTRAVED